MSVVIVFAQLALCGCASFLFIGVFSFLVINGKKEKEPSFSGSCLNLLGAFALAILGTILLVLAALAVWVWAYSKNETVKQIPKIEAQIMRKQGAESGLKRL